MKTASAILKPHLDLLSLELGGGWGRALWCALWRVLQVIPMLMDVWEPHSTPLLDAPEKATSSHLVGKGFPSSSESVLFFQSYSSSSLILLNAGSFPSLEELNLVSLIMWKEPPPPTPTLSQHRIFTLFLKRKINKYRKPESKLQTNHKKPLVYVWTVCA